VQALRKAVAIASADIAGKATAKEANAPGIGIPPDGHAIPIDTATKTARVTVFIILSPIIGILSVETICSTLSTQVVEISMSLGCCALRRKPYSGLFQSINFLSITPESLIKWIPTLPDRASGDTTVLVVGTAAMAASRGSTVKTLDRSFIAPENILLINVATMGYRSVPPDYTGVPGNCNEVAWPSPTTKQPTSQCAGTKGSAEFFRFDLTPLPCRTQIISCMAIGHGSCCRN